jgi:hypothetical protein
MTPHVTSDMPQISRPSEKAACGMPGGGAVCFAIDVALGGYMSNHLCGANQPRCGRLNPAARKKGVASPARRAAPIVAKRATISSATAPSG